MNQRLGPIALSSGVLLALVLASCWLRLDALSYKRCLDRDEATSYIAAAGKQRAFAENTLANRWVPASEWSAHHRIDEPFAFERIREDLIAHDIHPPLYFWLLHLAGLADGELGLSTGGRLNLALHVCAMALLFTLAWLSGGQLAVAALGVALWTFSPPVISTSLLARQYELMGLLAIASFASLSAVMQSERRRPMAALGLAGSLSLAALTHYQALLLAPALGVVALASGGLQLRSGAGRDRAVRSLAWAAGAILAGLALYFAVQPQAWSEAAGELHTQNATLTWATARSATILKTLGHFTAGLPGGAIWLGATALAAGAFTALVVARGLRRQSTPWDIEALRGQLYSFLPLLLLAGPIIFLYASLQTARHAMGDRYLALLWPFLALWLAQPLRLAPRAWGLPLLVAATLALSFGLGGAATRLAPVASQCWPQELRLVAQYDAVVLNNTRRGRLASFFPHWDGDTQVFASPGMAIFEHSGELLDGLENHSDTLVFHLRDTGVAQNSRSRLVELLTREGYELSAPDDPSTLIQPNATILLLVAPRTTWPPGLLIWARQLGAQPPLDDDQSYGLLTSGGEVVREALGKRRSLVIEGELAGEAAVGIRGTVQTRANPDRPASLRVELGDERVLEGPGSLAIAVLDSRTGEVLAGRIAAAGRQWGPRRASFRVWRATDEPMGEEADPLSAADAPSSSATLSPLGEGAPAVDDRSLGEE